MRHQLGKLGQGHAAVVVHVVAVFNVFIITFFHYFHSVPNNLHQHHIVRQDRRHSNVVEEVVKLHFKGPAHSFLPIFCEDQPDHQFINCL